MLDTVLGLLIIVSVMTLLNGPAYYWIGKPIIIVLAVLALILTLA